MPCIRRRLSRAWSRAPAQAQGPLLPLVPCSLECVPRTVRPPKWQGSTVSLGGTVGWKPVLPLYQCRDLRRSLVGAYERKRSDSKSVLKNMQVTSPHDSHLKNITCMKQRAIIRASATCTMTSEPLHRLSTHPDSTGCHHNAGSSLEIGVALPLDLFSLCQTEPRRCVLGYFVPCCAGAQRAPKPVLG